jgi:hypothetical protein
MMRCFSRCKSITKSVKKIKLLILQKARIPFANDENSVVSKLGQ